MTCIVGVRDGDDVVIGADRAAISGWDLQIRADEKVFTVGPYLIGFTTSFRMGQLLRYRLKPPAPPDDPGLLHGFMVTEFVDALRACLKAGGFASEHDKAEKGGEFLVGVNGRIFFVGDDYQVGEPVDGFAACGCGAAYALGALHATNGEMGADRRIRAALEAAERFSGGVRGPFVIVRRCVGGVISMGAPSRTAPQPTSPSDSAAERR